MEIKEAPFGRYVVLRESEWPAHVPWFDWARARAVDNRRKYSMDTCVVAFQHDQQLFFGMVLARTGEAPAYEHVCDFYNRDEDHPYAPVSLGFKPLEEILITLCERS